MARDPARPRQPAARAAALASVPPYYVALTGYAGRRQHAVVRASATGAVLATITAPKPYRTLTWVSGAADDRTFVLAGAAVVADQAGKGRPRGGEAGQRHPGQVLPAAAQPARTRGAADRHCPCPRSRGQCSWQASRCPRTAASSPSPCTVPVRTRSETRDPRHQPGHRVAARVGLARYRMGRQLQADRRAAVLDGRRADARVPEVDGKQRRRCVSSTPPRRAAACGRPGWS